MLKMQTVFTEKEALADINLNIFSPYRHKKIELCHNPEARICGIAASLALMRALRELGISERNCEYTENEFGKPYFKNHSELHFSLSHTNGLSIAVLSDTPVGVDCERSSREISPAVAKRFFSFTEVVAYQASLISLWTAKEAYSKCLGMPFAECAKKIELPFFENKLIQNGIEFQRISLSGFDVCVARTCKI